MKSSVGSSFLFTALLMRVFCLETISAEQSCTSNTGAPGVCVRIRDCASLHDYVANRPIMGIGAMLSSVCSFGFFKVMVCCPLELPKDENTPLLPPHCGHSAGLHNRIVGGNDAALNAWPWMAAIAFRFGNDSGDFIFSCGGTLVSSRHVVTAAHCLEYEEVSYQVRLGAHDLENTDDGSHPIDVIVESYVVHPEYNNTSKENDIAILRLDRDVEFTKAIHPICLPIEKNLRNRDFVGTYPFVAGWGATSYEGEESDVLQEVQVPVVSNEQCKKDYAAKRVVIDERVLCAGWPNGGKDACQGDSGGPLMWPKQTTYYLIGVVSTGSKCATAQFPGIYSRVTHFLNFIISNMK
ncbi:venom protease isoform X2 [Nasonia vitripennis]|uniref:CLIP domain-containing serine protease n=1 Tax=Nasonia vitripennis TaxID=7425 RepID=A0A7M7Q1P4_NASVI|nr:venom protease isoform X2 [Nasonia vitripennis]XP_031780171.1 venom protease isoform X2 [Nasonia vitripennis]